MRWRGRIEEKKEAFSRTKGDEARDKGSRVGEIVCRRVAGRSKRRSHTDSSESQITLRKPERRGKTGGIILLQKHRYTGRGSNADKA